MYRSVLLILALIPTPLLAQQQSEGEVFLFQEVDAKPRLLPGTVLYYPKDAQATAGVVTATFVVDTTGAVDARSIRILAAPSPPFAAAARAILLAQRYTPGGSHGQLVRVLTQSTLRFRPGAVACDSVVSFQAEDLCTGPPIRKQ